MRFQAGINQDVWPYSSHLLVGIPSHCYAEQVQESEREEAYVASPEDVIVKKLEDFREGGSEKHLRDIRGILANTDVDRGYLQHWIDRQALNREWALV